MALLPSNQATMLCGHVVVLDTQPTTSAPVQSFQREASRQDLMLAASFLIHFCHFITFLLLYFSPASCWINKEWMNYASSSVTDCHITVRTQLANAPLIRVWLHDTIAVWLLFVAAGKRANFCCTKACGDIILHASTVAAAQRAAAKSIFKNPRKCCCCCSHGNTG